MSVCLELPGDGSLARGLNVNRIRLVSIAWLPVALLVGWWLGSFGITRSESPTVAVASSMGSMSHVQVIGARFDRKGTNCRVTGEVANISTRPLQDVMVIIELRSRSGELLKQDRAVLPSRVLRPGARTGFQVLAEAVDGAESARLVFQTMDGDPIDAS